MPNRGSLQPEPAPGHYLITGGTGLIGSNLVRELLAAGCRVSVLTRDVTRAARTQEGPVQWLTSLAVPLEDVSCVINLAGEPLAGQRWTAAKKQRIFDSRIGVTEALHQWASRRHMPLPRLINASAVGFYGNRGAEKLPESAPPGSGFSSLLCRQWEAAALRFAEQGTAVYRLRFGVVLARNGGAFPELARPYQFKLGVTLGPGTQFLSWIHVADAVAAILFCASAKPPPAGAYNAVAPEVTTYAELAAELAARKRPWVRVKAPGALLKLGLGEMAEELLLASQWAVPAALQGAGFNYQYPTLRSALAALV